MVPNTRPLDGSTLLILFFENAYFLLSILYYEKVGNFENLRWVSKSDWEVSCSLPGSRNPYYKHSEIDVCTTGPWRIVTNMRPLDHSYSPSINSQNHHCLKKCRNFKKKSTILKIDTRRVGVIEKSRVRNFFSDFYFSFQLYISFFGGYENRSTSGNFIFAELAFSWCIHFENVSSQWKPV